MANTKDEFLEKKMKMWKMKEEFLNSMNDKELRAFIKGYMRMAFKKLKMLHMMHGSHGGCECGDKDCNCNRE
jgi:hypothetical protein